MVIRAAALLGLLIGLGAAPAVAASTVSRLDLEGVISPVTLRLVETAIDRAQ